MHSFKNFRRGIQDAHLGIHHPDIIHIFIIGGIGGDDPAFQTLYCQDRSSDQLRLSEGHVLAFPVYRRVASGRLHAAGPRSCLISGDNKNKPQNKFEGGGQIFCTKGCLRSS